MATAGTKGGHRYEALDSLRGICACMIVLYHFDSPGWINRSTFVQNSFLFVDFFFVLSGFVIAASYGDRLADGFSIGKFMGLRLGRIYPLHLAMLLIFLIFELVFAAGGLGGLGHTDRRAFHAPNDLPSFLYSLALIQTFVPLYNQGWNNPSWSIQVEIWTYLLFAVGFRWLGRFLVPAALVLAAGCAAYIYQRSDRYLDLNHEGAFQRCIYGFSLGVVAFRIHRAGKTTWSWLTATMLEIGAVIGVVVLVTVAGASPLSIIVPPFFLGVILVFCEQRGAISALLLRPLPRTLGVLSYSIYMIHRFLIYRTINVLTLIENHSGHRLSLVIHKSGETVLGGSPQFGDVMSIAFLALVIGCANLTYRLFERPAQRWSRRRILGEHPRSAAVRAEIEAPTF